MKSVNQTEILKIFKDAGALLEGHFLLSSGLHSGQYLQCARVLENPQIAQELCRALAENFKNQRISAVIGPAIGGIIVAYELARALGARALFAERESGKMCLRRGFDLSFKDEVVIAEDVITTGGSAKEVIELVRATRAQVVALCALADRSQGRIDFGVKRIALLELDIKNFSADNCPLCKQGIELGKPGSRSFGGK
jgi:orotate phosphoribosyltransferase